MKILLIVILLSLYGICSAQDSSQYSNLDHSFVNNKVLFDVYNTEKSDSSRISGITSGSILGELLLAPIAGVICTIPFIPIGGFEAIPFMYLGYVAGSALGVYLIGHYGNSNTSFLLTLGAGCAGTGLAFALLYMDNNKSLNSWDAYAFMGLPVLFEILYANLLVPDEYIQTGLKGKTDGLSKTKLIAYKDIYNSTLIFHTEIFRLNF